MKSNLTSFFRLKPACILWIACAATSGRFIRADYVILRNGATIEGRCLNPTDANSTEWQIETDDGLELSISRREVAEIRPSTADQKKYTDALAKKDDSLESHRQIVAGCLKLGLDRLADAHRERIVELDPSDKSAWAALDYVETPQGWIPRDIFQKRRGLQKKGSRYFVPQDLAIQQVSEQSTLLSAMMSKKVDKAFLDIRTKSPKAAEALQFLNTLQDPLALKKLREILKNERKNGNIQLRLQLVEIISRIHTNGAVLALIDTTLFDPDQSVRGESIAKLSEYGREMAVVTLMALLTNSTPSKDNPETYERVSVALAVLGDERCIPRLIDCLVTDHVRTPPPQPGFNAGAQSNGNMQFSQGSPKPEKIEIKNDGVLAALQSICQGENYGFDVQAWRNWYANAYAVANPNVLRDP